MSQEQFGQAIGVSQRLPAYYENHAQKAPAHHLAPGSAAPSGSAALMQMAGVLRVSIDELLGYKPSQAAARAATRNPRLWSKLRQVESLPLKERKQVLQFIEALVERDAQKRKR